MTPNTDMLLPVAVAALLTAGTTYLSLEFGIVPLAIVGGAGVPAYLLWLTCYVKRPTDPAAILGPFLAAVAGFELHLIEEYLGHYGPAVGRLFGFAWTDKSFVVIAFVLSSALSLAAVGLYRRNKVAGFVATLFLTTRLAECGLFIFPFLRPTLLPGTPEPISQEIAGALVQDMPNHYLATVGHFYFPGMYTVILPMAPALYALFQIWKARPDAAVVT